MKEVKRVGDIRHTIMEMTTLSIPMPLRPKPPVGKGSNGDLNAKQQDKHDFMCELYKQDVKS